MLIRKVSDKPLIFVSCGQFLPSEKQLGSDICALLAELRPDTTPYFAEDQSTVDGLSNHILRALYRAAGFICVMHPRGEMTTPDRQTVTRGSVWIEQEIAIAAFMQHDLGRTIPIFFYQHVGIGREGIRSVLLMNPRLTFTDDADVLADLRRALPSAVFNPYQRYDLEPKLSHRRVRPTSGDRHDYQLIADITNVGEERITDFRMRVYFPRAFLETATVLAAEDRTKSTETHICFIADARDRAPRGLYPGDGMTNPLSIDYYVNHQLYHDPRTMMSDIIVELFSGSMRQKKYTFPISKFHDF